MLQSFSVLTGTFQRLLVLFKGFVLRLQKSFFVSALGAQIEYHTSRLLSTLFGKFFLSFLQSLQACGNRHDLNVLRFALGIFRGSFFYLCSLPRMVLSPVRP